MKKDTESIINPCPICGYLTLAERGADDICEVCYWHDDGFDDDLDEISGPNGELSINKARQNFNLIGAIEIRLLAFVRSPKESQLVPGLPSAQAIKERQDAARNKYRDEIIKQNDPRNW